MHSASDGVSLRLREWRAGLLAPAVTVRVGVAWAWRGHSVGMAWAWRERGVSVVVASVWHASTPLVTANSVSGGRRCHSTETHLEGSPAAWRQ